MSAQATLWAVSAVDPANSYALQPRDGVTLCNEAVRFMLAARGIAIPRLVANDQHDWLAQQPDWRKVEDVAEVERLIETGAAVVFAWKNPTGATAHGHIALGVPAPPGKSGLFCAAAGIRNTNCAPIEEQFGLSIHPDFFVKEI